MEPLALKVIQSGSVELRATPSGMGMVCQLSCWALVKETVCVETRVEAEVLAPW